MDRHLPPLNGLRAFEAAARHLSVTKAAAELHVTPAAISHQIKGLEGQLGVTLFRRLNKALLLTEAGQRGLPRLREGFDALADAVAAMCDRSRDGPLTVSVAPSLASLWLVYRLERFRRHHPDMEVTLHASSTLVDFDRDPVDIGIRYGQGRYPGLATMPLWQDRVTPVCCPALAEGRLPPGRALRTPGDLASHTLLHILYGPDDRPYPDWRQWLAAAGVEGLESERGPRFSATAMATQVAMEGHGVALVDPVLVRRELADGRLVAPFDVALTSPFGYTLVYPERAAADPRVQAFRDWLLAEIAADTHDTTDRAS